MSKKDNYTIGVGKKTVAGEPIGALYKDQQLKRIGRQALNSSVHDPSTSTPAKHPEFYKFKRTSGYSTPRLATPKGILPSVGGLAGAYSGAQDLKKAVHDPAYIQWMSGTPKEL